MRGSFFAVVLLLLFAFSFGPVFAQQSVAAKNRYKIAKNFAVSGNLDAAERELTEALRLDGHYGDALYLMGLVQSEKKNYEKAIEFFKKVISEHPKFYTARLHLASAFLAMDERDKASEQIDYYVTNMPSDPEGHYAKGCLYYVKGDLNAAVKSWDKAISLKREHVYSHYNRGIALFWLGRRDDGISSVERALELKTTSLPFRFTLGRLRYISGRTVDAGKEFKYLAEASPESHIGLVSAGYLLLSEKKYDEAAAKADAALKIDPSFSPAMELKSYALEGKGEYDEAIRLCEEILKGDGNDRNASERMSSLKSLRDSRPSGAAGAGDSGDEPVKAGEDGEDGAPRDEGGGSEPAPPGE